MGDSDDEVAQPFWVVAKMVLNDIAVPQLVSVAILAICFKQLLRLARGKSSWVSAFSLALLASYVAWPQVSIFWLHIEDPQHYPLATYLFIPAPAPLSVGQAAAIFLIMLIYCPTTFNQNSLWLLILLLPMAITARSINREIRWIGYLCLFIFLPVAWLLDCFNEGTISDRP